MSILRQMVIATSTALVASSVLASAATAAPAPTFSASPTETSIDSALNPKLIENIAASLAVASISPAKSAKSLDSQIARIDLALQDAEAAALEAAGNVVVAGEGAARTNTASLSGTSLSKFVTSSAEIERQKVIDLAATAQAMYAQADKQLGAKRTELISASAKARHTSVAVETARLKKETESRSEAELMAALAESESTVADPVNDPSLDPETIDMVGMSTASLGSASIAGGTVQLPTAVSRAKRIDTSIRWAKKVAGNNKYKYRYGATGPTYFDCSGYTGKAFSTGGKKLQRTSGSQYKAAPKKVKLSKMQKGDLVFWSSNGGRSFYHVAIYVGGGKIAHARNPSAGISVTNLNYAGMRNIYKYAGRY
ncbi:C40 family peptidase [Paeniglutamicibacter sp. NPDC091659]|uniref:C40 family peptidase n=1 Tax=Paeniglutamicibacter sp. NPDC091659 TaxID=3364389 RepID=UPI0037FCAABC